MERGEKLEKIKRRKKRIRAKVFGTKERPRLCIFISQKHIYAQLIDDSEAKTLISTSDREVKNKNLKKTEIAREVGRLIAQKAKDLNIQKIVFDRGSKKYHGKVKALAEGAREGGLKF